MITIKVVYCDKNGRKICIDDDKKQEENIMEHFRR